MGLLNKLIGSVVKRRQKLYFGYVRVLGSLLRFRASKGESVMERDWDNLIVLDACRYDSFEKLNSFDGELEKFRSKATATPQWLKRNFTDYYDDVIYVTGNPYAPKLAEDGYFDAEEHFFKVVHVWDTDWDDELGTVRPDDMNKRVREIKEQHPDKRIIAHYMQPHEPFIGETELPGERTCFTDRWERLNRPELKQAYEDNLELVMESLEDLLPDLEGKTVVTGDHGELVKGKYGLFTHPKDVFIEELYTVPWFEISEQAS